MIDEGIDQDLDMPRYRQLHEWLILYSWKGEQRHWLLWKSYKSERQAQDALNNLRRTYGDQSYMANDFRVQHRTRPVPEAQQTATASREN